MRASVDQPIEEPELELVNDHRKLHEPGWATKIEFLAEEAAPPPAEEAPQTTPADSERARLDRFWGMTWEVYTSFGSRNSSKANAHRRWLALTDDDRTDCYVGLMRYRDSMAAERRRRPDAPAKHLETFIDARSWESYQQPDRPD